MDDKMENSTDVFYKKGIKYSVTLNPEKQFFGDDQRFKKFRHEMFELFQGLGPNKIDYTMHIELSEPREVKPGGSGSRYHLHGWFEFKTETSILYFLDYFQYKMSRIGYYELDICNDLNKWYKYMTKQSHIFPKKYNTVLTNFVIKTSDSEVEERSDEMHVEHPRPSTKEKRSSSEARQLTTGQN